MTVDIRPITEDELVEYRRVATTALMISPSILPPEAIEAIRPEMTLCAFEAGKLATAYAWWPLKMHMNGGIAPVAGVTFVGTLPVYRRRGHLRRVIGKHFERIKESGGQPVTVLIASQASIYQRYGYGIVSTRQSYDVAPRDLVFSQPDLAVDPVGTLREVENHETDRLKEVYNAFCLDRTGYLVRKDPWWAAAPLAPAGRNEVLCKIAYEEHGRLTGYVLYTIASRPAAKGHPWQQVSIRDYAWLTPSAFRAIWGHFAAMDLGANINCMKVPADDPLPHLLLEPRRLNMALADGLLARIVDVQRALPLRRYDHEGELTFQLVDELCRWNEGNWRLTVSNGAAELQQTTRKPQIMLPVDTLAMLVFGQITPSQAVRMGRAEVQDREVLSLWDRVMSTRYRPFCPDFF